MIIKNYLKNPTKILTRLDNIGIIHIPDTIYLKLKYRQATGKRLNLKCPRTFNEKLQWLKLYNRNPKYTNLVDKYEVKKFVTNIVGEKYVIPTIGIYEKFDDINFDELPNQFVMKCTHDSGGIVICKDKSKLNIQEAREKISNCLKVNYYYKGREWPYKNVKPRILIEKYMEDEKQTAINAHQGGMLNDYKFWTFSGVPKAVYVTIKGKNIYENFYDMSFEKLDISHETFGRYSPEFIKPDTFDEMKEIVSTLASVIKAPFLRVDLFYINGKVYFSEFTFYDWGGLKPFKTNSQNEKLGKWITLPEKY